MNNPALSAMGRRRPRQERSRALVEAILEAAALLLARHGRDALTTNAVAMRAGVSIGSLYQYFPNAESILKAAAARHLDQIATMIGHVPLRDAGSLAEATARIVAVMFEAHRLDPALHLALANEQAEGAQATAQTAVMALFGSLPKVLRDEAGCRDYDRAIGVAAEVIHALAHAAIRQPDEAAHFEAEALSVTLAYLRSAT